MVDLRHIGVEEGRRLLRVREYVDQLGLACFQSADLVLQFRSRHTFKDGLNRFIELALSPLELASLRLDIGPALDPQPIHLTGKFLAEFLEQFGFHEMRAEAA
ncbi:hypothetical protein [Bradyrhizobium sacchari]|uniref:hypothetical protein n=1 Tax=Bradyrhizobium sacchari TaxID=1399419 RepID=UPI0032218392